MPIVKNMHNELCKDEICKVCGSLITYYPNDVHTDYDFDSDYYNFVVCPVCGYHMKVDGFDAFISKDISCLAKKLNRKLEKEIN